MLSLIVRGDGGAGAGQAFGLGIVVHGLGRG